MFCINNGYHSYIIFKMDSKVPTVTRRRKPVAMSKSTSSDGMMVRGKKENPKLSKRKKKKPVTRASTPPKSSAALKKSASSPAKVHLPSLKLTSKSEVADINCVSAVLCRWERYARLVSCTAHTTACAIELLI